MSADTKIDYYRCGNIVSISQEDIRRASERAGVVFGDYNPGGKLPITFPRSAGHLQTWYNQKKTHSHNKYKYGDSSPLYEFGHGLSYTTFAYTDLQVPKRLPIGQDLKLNMDVVNTGKLAGDEVVQVYLRDMVSSVTTPIRRLVAFERITLQPGQKRRVDLVITSRQLSIYNRQMKQVVEPGRFKLMVGGLGKEFLAVAP